VSPNIKKQANLRLPLNVLKLEMFQLQGGGGFYFVRFMAAVVINMEYIYIPVHYIAVISSGQTGKIMSVAYAHYCIENRPTDTTIISVTVTGISSDTTGNLST